MQTRAECIKTYGSDYYIKQNIEAGDLYRLEKGIYSSQKDVPELAMLSFKYPNAIITMEMAYYLYELTDVVPDKYTYATDRDAAKIKDLRIKQYFQPSEFFEDGISSINYYGYDLKIYSRERMLIELIRHKTKLPFDYYKELILSYRKILPSLNIQTVQDLAIVAPKSSYILKTLQLEVF